MALLAKLVLALIFLPLPTFIVIFRSWDYYYDYVTHEDSTGKVFDYIIVGSGSAGAPLAARLSKNSKVLLLEAGGDPLVFNSVPGIFTMLLNRPETDWMHETVPQKNALLMTEGQVSKWPRGKSLGGTSNANAMLYMRGHPLDYDNWANLTGDPTWKYENLLPSFKRSLDYHGEFGDNEKHYGQTPYGHLHVEPLYIPRDPLYQYWLDAGKELGYEERDLNGPQSSGFGIPEITRKHGRRSSTYTAFLEGIRNRKNLHISKYSQVTKIHLDSNNRAIGVWYVQHGMKKYARASREIIISAGSIDSPKLLMLSGLGPKKHLKSVGIKPRVDLPVGQNLQDHMQCQLLNILIDKPLSFTFSEDFGLSALTDYLLHGTGPLSLPWPVNGLAFISTSQVSKSDSGKQIDWPDIQLYSAGFGISDTSHLDLALLLGVDADILQKFFSKSVGQHAIVISSALVRPKSVGEILLRNKDPLSSPIIDPHYLEDPQDVRAYVEGFQFALRLIETTKSYKKLGARLAPTPLPPCANLKFKSDAYFECYVRNMASTIFHPTGTCRMGHVDDPRTVVDSQLRVKGIHGLRVADASIMPEIVNANTNAPAIMIGEKAAELIREYWAQQFLVCDKFAYIFRKKHYRTSCYYWKLV